MAEARTFHIRPVLDGQTLAAGLRRLVAELSWADARQLVHGRHVQVNGNLVLDETRRLKAGDVVKVFEHARAAVPTEKDVRVRYLDADLMVVEKPAGMTTLRHAEERDWDDRRKQRQPTLDEVLQRMLPGLLRKQTGGPNPGQAEHRPGPRQHPLARPPHGQAKPGPPSRHDPRPGRPPPHAHPLHAHPRDAARGPARGTPPHGTPPPPVKVPRVRPVHRLDRDTSGLMVFALSHRAEQALVAMFKKHDVRRAYLAVAHGRVEAGTVESWLVRDRGDGLRGSTPRGQADPEAKQAVTHVRPVEHLGEAYTIIECRLETGRTHQIRIHLAESGHMLCGEKTYTRPTPASPPTPDRSGAPRHALHSAELQLTHPVTGKDLQFTSSWPPDLEAWLRRLREAGKRPS